MSTRIGRRRDRCRRRRRRDTASLRARFGRARIGRLLLPAVVSMSWWWAAPVSAQSTPLDEGPSSAGMPGAEFVRELVGWGKWLGLGACGLMMIYGAATWAGFGAASAGRAVQGKTYVLGGLIGAAVIGLVAVVVPLLYQAANG